MYIVTRYDILTLFNIKGQLAPLQKWLIDKSLLFRDTPFQSY